MIKHIIIMFLTWLCWVNSVGTEWILKRLFLWSQGGEEKDEVR